MYTATREQLNPSLNFFYLLFSQRSSLVIVISLHSESMVVLKLLAVLSGLCFIDANPTTTGATDTVTVTVTVNQTAILPFNLSTTLNMTDLHIEWKYGDKFVHSYQSGKDYLKNQDKDFGGRTSLFSHDELAAGNVSLKLSSVTEQDEGNYTCRVFDESIPGGRKTQLFHLEVHLKLEQRQPDRSKKNTTAIPTTPPDNTGAIVGGVGVVGVLLVMIIVGLWWKFGRPRGGRTQVRTEDKREDRREDEPEDRRENRREELEMQSNTDPNAHEASGCLTHRHK